MDVQTKIYGVREKPQNNLCLGFGTLHSHKYKEIPKIFSPYQVSLMEKSFRDELFKSNTPIRKFLRTRNLVLFLLSSRLGLRTSEALKIRIDDIDFNKQTLYISGDSNKTRRSRVLPLTKELIKELRLYLAIISDQNIKYIFSSIEGERFSDDQWQDVFQQHLKLTGLYQKPTRRTRGGYSPYTLRHTFATQLYCKTKDIYLVAHFLGHTSLESTTIYIHLAAMYYGDYLQEMRKQIEVLH